MSIRTALVAVTAFAAGLATFALWDATETPAVASSDARAASIAEHWEAVEAYREYVLDPSSSRLDPQTGFSVITPPSDPMPSLAALVAAGEIEHVDLVFPNVPRNRATTRYWMEWAGEKGDVLYAEGNPQYAAFQPSGEQPLHLKLWFRKAATADVQKLIIDLEQIAMEAGEPSAAN